MSNSIVHLIVVNCGSNFWYLVSIIIPLDIKYMCFFRAGSFTNPQAQTTVVRQSLRVLHSRLTWSLSLNIHMVKTTWTLMMYMVRLINDWFVRYIISSVLLVVLPLVLTYIDISLCMPWWGTFSMWRDVHGAMTSSRRKGPKPSKTQMICVSSACCRGAASAQQWSESSGWSQVD